MAKSNKLGSFYTWVAIRRCRGVGLGMGVTIHRQIGIIVVSTGCDLQLISTHNYNISTLRHQGGSPS